MTSFTVKKGHILHRHGMQRIIRATITTATPTYLFGYLLARTELKKRRRKMPKKLLSSSLALTETGFDRRDEQREGERLLCSFSKNFHSRSLSYPGMRRKNFFRADDASPENANKN